MLHNYFKTAWRNITRTFGYSTLNVVGLAIGMVVSLLLSKDFIVLVLISCLIAAPISFYFLHNWLMNYDYRISIGAGVFALAGLMASLIKIITVSFQSIKAAIAIP